jgi:hypothetical protein
MSRDSENKNPGSFDLSEKPRAASREALASAMRTFPTRRRNAVTQEMTDPERHPVRDFYAPIVLLIAGVLAWFGLGLFAPLYPERGLWISAAVILTAFITNLALLLSGVFLASMILSINFGSLSQAILKLSAIGTFAGAIFMLFARLDIRSMRGPIMGWHAVVLLYWFFFSNLFELETQETLLTVAIVAFTQAAGACIVLQI